MVGTVLISGVIIYSAVDLNGWFVFDYEKNQVEFQRIKEQFYEEVVYADNGPGAEEYRAYYEEMDPTTAETLYKQVVQEEVVSNKVKDYVATFSNMDAAKAAAIPAA